MDDQNRDVPDDTPDLEKRGVAALFKATELRRFVKGYLFFILMLEIFIFLVCFLSQLEPINIPFPWRNYFLGALLIPIAITFLLGVFVTAFNLFLFSESPPAPSAGDGGKPAEPDPNPSRYQKIAAAVEAIRQVPFLLSLLLLCVAIIAIVHLDNLFAAFTSVSTTAMRFAFWGFCVLVGGGAVLAVVLLISRYRLEKDRQDREFQYRQEMAERLGVIITDPHLAIRSGSGVVMLPEPPSRSGDEAEVVDGADAASGGSPTEADLP